MCLVLFCFIEDTRGTRCSCSPSVSLYFSLLLVRLDVCGPQTGRGDRCSCSPHVVFFTGFFYVLLVCFIFFFFPDSMYAVRRPVRRSLLLLTFLLSFFAFSSCPSVFFFFFFSIVCVCGPQTGKEDPRRGELQRGRWTGENMDAAGKNAQNCAEGAPTFVGGFSNYVRWCCTANCSHASYHRLISVFFLVFARGREPSLGA